MRFTTEQDRRKRRPAPLPAETLFDLMSRVLGLIALVFSVVAMARLMGVPGLNPSRFDLMPVEWRTASTMLTILYAAAGFGLWQLTRWGLVVWVTASIMHIMMHSLFTQYFGENLQLIMLIIGLLSTYFTFGFYVYIGRRNRQLIKH